MKIAIYTLTRDRIEYTKKCFQSLQENAGYSYDHYIIDNGSKDGTADWLKEGNYTKVIYNPENVGISNGSNQALRFDN
jgi:GT2 family glycosyltransferase